MGEYVVDDEARSWNDLKREFDLTEAERDLITAGAQRLVAESRAFRFSQARRRRWPGTNRPDAFVGTCL